jgi:hypothetical membrane protein
VKAAFAGRYISIGAAFYIVGTVQFLIGMSITALYYGPPSYNLHRNSISDLQAITCGIFQGNEICSPLHLLANSSVAFLGLLVILGTLLIRSSFPSGRGWSSAFTFLIVAGLGALANGFTPEDVSPTADTLTALVAFISANLGLIQIGRLMSRDSKWRGLGHYTEISGVIGLTALVLFGTSVTGPLGPGVMEWLIVVPILLWTFVIGTDLFRIRQVNYD